MIEQVVSEGLQDLSVMIPNFDIKPRMVDVWSDALRDIHPELLESAFKQLTRSFRPKFWGDSITPGLVRETAMAMVTDSWASAFEECMLAAHKLENPVMKTGPDDKPIPAECFQFSSPVVQETFRQFGGIEAFIGVKDGDRTIRAQFREVYNTEKAKIQGESGGVQLVAQYRQNVTQIAAAREQRSQFQLQESVEKARERMRVLPSVHPELQESVTRKAKVLQEFVNKGANSEERAALRRRVIAQFMSGGEVDCWADIERPMQAKPSRDHLGIAQAARAVGLSIESFRFYAGYARVAIEEFHIPGQGPQEYVHVPDITKVFAAWESMNASAQ